MQKKWVVPERKEENIRASFPPTEINRAPEMVYPCIEQSTASTFIYINNFKKRNYQFDISIESIKGNTLVVLPTGLGKTFIAGVLILNFYRWFQNGKIIFVAPSKPLVTQQMKSIQQMTQINPKDVAEMTGTNDPKTRGLIWENSRVFFATPQTVQNDIEKRICPASQVVLVIIDEAHHAQGDHAYCKVVSGIAEYTRFFRVIGLTATPGSRFTQIQQVIYNLMISQIELRSDEDCREYTMHREIHHEYIPDSDGTKELVARINTVIKYCLVNLSSYNLVAHTDPVRTTKGQIALLKRLENLGDASKSVTSALRFLKFREYLQVYGIETFSQLASEALNSPEFQSEDYLHELRNIYATALRMPQTDLKMEKLITIVDSYLRTTEGSRIIIFCNFRRIVKGIVERLTEASNRIKCSMFIGQASNATSKGLNQAKQLQIIDSFRKGMFNTLVATAIGEEGLDIGEVDLIVCFDIQKSMIRTIQRMGRTGRKRNGKVIFLLSEIERGQIDSAKRTSNAVTDLVSRKISEFVFYPLFVMNPHKFAVIEKQIEYENTINVRNRKTSKRVTLLSSELDELHSSFGKTIHYHPFDLSKHTTYQTTFDASSISNSNESYVLSKVLNDIYHCDCSYQTVFKDDHVDAKMPIDPLPDYSSQSISFTMPTIEIPLEEARDTKKRNDFAALFGIELTDSSFSSNETDFIQEEETLDKSESDQLSETDSFYSESSSNLLECDDDTSLENTIDLLSSDTSAVSNLTVSNLIPNMKKSSNSKKKDFVLVLSSDSEFE